MAPRVTRASQARQLVSGGGSATRADDAAPPAAAAAQPPSKQRHAAAPEGAGEGLPAAAGARPRRAPAAEAARRDAAYAAAAAALPFVPAPYEAAAGRAGHAACGEPALGELLARLVRCREVDLGTRGRPRAWEDPVYASYVRDGGPADALGAAALRWARKCELAASLEDSLRLDDAWPHMGLPACEAFVRAGGGASAMMAAYRAVRQAMWAEWGVPPGETGEDGPDDDFDA